MSRKLELINRFNDGESLSTPPSFFHDYNLYRELTSEFGLTFRPINDDDIFVIYHDDNLDRDLSEFEYFEKCYLEPKFWQTENSIKFLKFVNNYNLFDAKITISFLENINLRKDYNKLLQNVDWLKFRIDVDSTDDFKLHDLVINQTFNDKENPPKNSSDATNIIRSIDLPHWKIVDIVERFNLNVGLISDMGFYSTRNRLSLMMIKNSEEELDE